MDYVVHTFGNFMGVLAGGEFRVVCLGDGAAMKDVFADCARILCFDSVRLARDERIPIQWLWVDDALVLANLALPAMEKTLLSVSMKVLGYDGRLDYELSQARKSLGGASDELTFAWLKQMCENISGISYALARAKMLEAYHWDLKASCALAAMEKRDVLIDRSAIPDAQAELKSLESDCVERMGELAGFPVNPRSPDQIAGVLEARGVNVKKRTAAMQMSTRSKYLKRFEESDEFVKNLLCWREVEHVKKIVLAKVAERARDGRLRVRYSLGNRLGEIDGEPELMARGPCEKALYSILRSPDPGETLVEYGFAELDRELDAAMRNDDQRKKAMWSAMNNGYVCLTSGRKIWIERDEVWKALDLWIEGTRADFVKQLVVKLARADHLPYLLFHDAVVLKQPADVIDARAEDPEAKPLSVAKDYARVRDVFMEVIGIETFPVEW